MKNYNHNPQNHRTRFKSKTLPPAVELAKKAIGVKLPVDIDAVVRAMPDISSFVRDSIIEKLERDAKLPENTEAIAPITPLNSITPPNSTQTPPPEPKQDEDYGISGVSGVISTPLSGGELESTIAPTPPPAKKTRRTPARVAKGTEEAIAPAPPPENPPEEKPAAKKRTPKKGVVK